MVARTLIFERYLGECFVWHRTAQSFAKIACSKLKRKFIVCKRSKKGIEVIENVYRMAIREINQLYGSEFKEEVGRGIVKRMSNEELESLGQIVSGFGDVTSGKAKGILSFGGKAISAIGRMRGQMEKKVEPEKDYGLIYFIIVIVIFFIGVCIAGIYFYHKDAEKRQKMAARFLRRGPRYGPTHQQPYVPMYGKTCEQNYYNQPYGQVYDYPAYNW